MINITDIRIFPNPKADESKVKAFASITLEGVISLNSMRVVEGRNGLFVAYPQQEIKPRINQKTGKEETARDTYHPITAEARNVIQDAVLSAYKGKMGQPQQTGYQSQPATPVVESTPVNEASAVNSTPSIMSNTASGPARF